MKVQKDSMQKGSMKKERKVIFQRFPSNADRLHFPYPPLCREPDTDYLCFTDDAGIHSSVWKILVVENPAQADLEPYLKEYALRRELQPEQIQMGGLLSEPDGEENVITAPALEDLPLVKLEPEKLAPTADAEGNYIYRRNPVYSGGKYNGRELLLTIGVPVSNQIGTIDRCLSHIKPLLDQLDAELLVIDTGSTDGTVEVCRKYGARVIRHPWSGNMSAARNEGIYHAKGEWYMSIDDDEWFEDVKEILRFFQQGHYRDYTKASYIQRNYVDSAGTVYEDNHTFRMARITPELHFEGRIHDALVTESTGGAFFVLHSYAHHYGFVSDDPEKVRAKAMRNIPVLLQDVYEYPMELRFLFQLANEYCTLHYWEAAVRLFAQTMALAKEAGDQYNGKNSKVLLCACLSDMGDQRLFRWSKNTEREFPSTVPEQAFIALSQMRLAFRTEKSPEQVLDYYYEYEALLERHRQNPLSGQFGTFFGLSVVEHEAYIMEARATAFCSYAAADEEEKALDMLERFSMEQIEGCRFPVLARGLAAADRVWEAVCDKLTQMQWEEWSGEILEAFFSGLGKDSLGRDSAGRDSVGKDSAGKESVYERLLTRVPGLLARFCVPDIISWFEHSERRREETIEKRLREYAMEYAMEGDSVQTLCLCAWVLKEAYVRNRKEENGREILYCYLSAVGAFAGRYYNPQLLLEPDCRVIPPDIRAACRMAVALADGKASHENVTLLKQALAVFPAFHEEIRSILMELGTDG